MVKSRRFFLSGAAAAFLGGCRRADTLRVSASGFVGLSPAHLTEELGLFEQMNVKVEWTPVQRSTEMIAMMAGGQLDVAFVTLQVSLFNAVPKGLTARIASARGHLVPGCNDSSAIFARRRVFPNGLTSVRQLKGKAVALPTPTGILSFYLGELLNRAGMSIIDLKIIILPETESLAALASGKVDAVLGTHAENGIEAPSLDLIRGPAFSALHPGFQTHFILFSQRLLADVEKGGRFLAAYFEGVREFRNGKTPRFLKDIVTQNNLVPEFPERLCRDTYLLDGAVRVADLQMYADWSLGRGFLSQPVNAAAVLDTRALQRASAIRAEWKGNRS